MALAGAGDGAARWLKFAAIGNDDVEIHQGAQCYLPSTPGELLVWALASGVAFVLLFGWGLIAFDTAKRSVTLHTLEFVEHLLLHATFYASVYSGWIGLGPCGFHLAQLCVSVVLAIVCLGCAFHVGKARAARDAREHNHQFKALVDALNGIPPDA